jgi:MFS transporter, SET family, sugar efflux transporter
MRETTIAVRSRVPVTLLIASSLFFTGITYASTLNYAAIVGIDTLGIPSGTYSLLLMAASLVSAVASVALGYVSDRIPDRRILVIACALTGAIGFGSIFLFRNQLSFVIATCVIMPFGGALMSQSFSFARSYLNAHDPARADFMITVLRTIFAVAWAIVPPAVGSLAAATTVFNVYGVAAAAYLVCAAIFSLMLLNPAARIGTLAESLSGTTTEPVEKASIDPAVMAGIAGVVVIFTATYLNMVTTPLLITNSLKGSFADLGLWAGLAAAMELPFMLLWGYTLKWVKKYVMIASAALLYAIYLVLLARAGSVTDVLWLQLINGPATAALMSIPISYLQEAIRGRVGLSTSLLDVSFVVSALAGAAIFGAVTAGGPSYELLLMIAGGLSTLGAVMLVTAHLMLGNKPMPARHGGG